MKNKLFYLSKIRCLFVFLILSVCISAQTNSDKNKSEEKVETALLIQENKPLRILEKPKASYPKPDTGTICAVGTVSLRVEFLATGEIGKISVVSGLPHGLSEKAIEAAEKIKFEPAVKNGLPVTVKKVVQYNFTFY